MIRLAIAIATYRAFTFPDKAIPYSLAAATPMPFEIRLYATKLLRHFRVA